MGSSRRKLSAILHADVVESTTLVQRNEVVAHERMQDAFRRLSAFIEAYGGIPHELRGDALLAEFGRASDALSAALAFQSANAAWNAKLADDIQPVVRIGISLGEVIVADGTLTGLGVVLAQRLEQLAAPGTVVVQGTASETVPSRLPFEFESLGECELKGFEQPVRAATVRTKSGEKLPHPEVDDGSAIRTDERPGWPDARAGKPVTKPSVAVLPFVNMSADPELEHFCDGITEDVITALSRSRWYDVTSHSSTFAYKGQSTDVRQVADELGVGYVLEGSLRKGGERIRVTAQLADASAGNHIWAERYQFNGADEFAVQDEIAHRVASNLGERIWQDVARNIGHQEADTYGPYECAFLGIEHLHRLDPDHVEQAKKHLIKALELDSHLPAAHLGLGFCYLIEYGFWGDLSGQALERAEKHAAKLQSLAPDDAQTFRLLSRLHVCRGRFDEARSCVGRALRINPDDGDIIAAMGVVLMFDGAFEDAIDWFDKVLALHSETPHTVEIMLMWKSIAQFCLTGYEQAGAALKGISGLDYVKSLLLAACYAEIGRDEDARMMANRALHHRPGLRVSNIGLWRYFRETKDQDHLRRALIRAGLPA